MTHYETLGVRRDASSEAIKAQFRRLSLELHPDVGGPTACAERFKQVSVAAGVLTNEKRRRAYDYQLKQKESMSFASAARHMHRTHSAGGRTGSPAATAATTPLQVFLGNVIRPRSFLIGIMAMGVGAVALSFRGDQRPLHHDGADHVKAWRNPRTGHYEQPAPWDPEYQRLQPVLEDVPRHLVRRRDR